MFFPSDIYQNDSFAKPESLRKCTLSPLPMYCIRKLKMFTFITHTHQLTICPFKNHFIHWFLYVAHCLKVLCQRCVEDAGWISWTLKLYEWNYNGFKFKTYTVDVHNYRVKTYDQCRGIFMTFFIKISYSQSQHLEEKKVSFKTLQMKWR